MFEIKAKLFTQRLYATHTDSSDWYKSVIYYTYQGDMDKVPFWYIKRTKDHTCFSHLGEDMDVILSKMGRSLRQEIRKAGRMGFDFEYGYFYDEFVEFYNAFAASKGIPIRVSKDRLLRYGKPIVTKMSFEGETLAMHVRVIDPESKFCYALYTSNARFKEGVNPRMASTANKYLQYKDLELCKEMGVETYDWAGVDINPSHSERFSIGEYKLEYGGEVAPAYILWSPIYAVMELTRSLLIKLKLWNR